MFAVNNIVTFEAKMRKTFGLNLNNVLMHQKILLSNTFCNNGWVGNNYMVKHGKNICNELL